MRLVKELVKRILPEPAIARYRAFAAARKLPHRAKALRDEDLKGLPSIDPGPRAALDLALSWLGRAQDSSTTDDGGVARHFSLVDGWSPSYPETTGYIIPTLLRESEMSASEADRNEFRSRARRMLDWLLSIQFSDGGFQGGTVISEPRVAVTFNTGQIVLGLAAGAQAFPEQQYAQAVHRAASWLAETLDEDGCWRRYPSPFTRPGEKSYDTHVSWGLFEAERVAPGKGYGEAGLRQVRFALTKQRDNGWIADCSLDSPEAPLTHTLGYALRGILEAHRISEEREFLAAGVKTAMGLRSCLGEDGHLAGRLDAVWRPTVSWACLTGTVQIAYCWFLLGEATGDERYVKAAQVANSFVRRTIIQRGDPDVVGGIRGSFPVSGDYGQYEFLNWAAKFFIDSNRKEIETGC